MLLSLISLYEFRQDGWAIQGYGFPMMFHRDRVEIKFVRDFEASDGSVYTSGSKYLIDHASADALIMAGVAMKISQVAVE